MPDLTDRRLDIVDLEIHVVTLEVRKLQGHDGRQARHCRVQRSQFFCPCHLVTGRRERDPPTSKIDGSICQRLGQAQQAVEAVF